MSLRSSFLVGLATLVLGSTAALATEKYVTGPYRFAMLEDLSHWLCEEAGGLITDVLLAHLSDYGDADG